MIQRNAAVCLVSFAVVLFWFISATKGSELNQTSYQILVAAKPSQGTHKGVASSGGNGAIGAGVRDD